MTRLLSTCLVIAGIGTQARMPSEKIETLAPFIDELVPKLMEQAHVPGVAVAVVHDGHVVTLRGYGQSRLDAGRPVDPSRTLFRIGSVSKLFTAIAALQLVDSGQLDLNQDVRTYVPDFPLKYGATTHQLLTHTAGMGERYIGASTDAADHVRPLAAHLRDDPPEQVIRPGTAYTYSNYNYAVAGLVIEKLSGLTYEQYMADHVFAPLRMISTTAQQPPAPTLASDLARGYHWARGHEHALPLTFTYASPAGGISTTAGDMARLMLALLDDGSLDGERVLSTKSRQTLLAPQYTPDPRIPPVAYGLKHWMTHGQRLLHGDGTLGDQIGVILLAPADRFGIFIASNGYPEDVGNRMLSPLLTYLVGPALPPQSPPSPLPDARRRSRRFTGAYRDYRHTRNDMSRIVALTPAIQSRLVVEADGAVRWKGHRWVQIEPLVFQSTDRPEFEADRPDYIVFREDRDGRIAELHAWGATFERIGWWEQTWFHLAVLTSCTIAFLAYPLFRWIRGLRHRGEPDEGRAARRCAVLVALTNLMFIGGSVVFFRHVATGTIPLPFSVVSWLLLPLVSLVGTVVLAALAVKAWRERWWTRGERLGFSMFLTMAVVFMVFLDYWKLLGIRY